MSKLSLPQQCYYSQAVCDLAENKVDYHFSRTKSIEDCSGYFDHTGPTLKIAGWKKNWFEVFIHEYNHYKQWKTNSKYWKQAEDSDFLGTFNTDEMLVTQLMEQECDMMSWADIQRWGLKGLDNYIQTANAYHVSYKNIADNKAWFYQNNTPSSFVEITSLCPSDRFWTKKELQNPPKRLYKRINDYCFDL